MQDPHYVQRSIENIKKILTISNSRNLNIEGVAFLFPSRSAQLTPRFAERRTRPHGTHGPTPAGRFRAARPLFSFKLDIFREKPLIPSKAERKHQVRIPNPRKKTSINARSSNIPYPRKGHTRSSPSHLESRPRGCNIPPTVNSPKVAGKAAPSPTKHPWMCRSYHPLLPKGYWDAARLYVCLLLLLGGGVLDVRRRSEAAQGRGVVGERGGPQEGGRGLVGGRDVIS